MPLALLGAAAETAGAAVVLLLLRSLTAEESSFAGQTSPIHSTLAWLAALFIGKNLLLAVIERLQARWASSAASSLSSRLVDAYLNAPYLHLRRSGSSAALHRVTLSVAETFQLVLGPSIHLLGESAVALGLVVLLAVVSPFAALAAALPIALLVGLFLILTRTIVTRAGERYDAAQAQVLARLQQSLRAHKEIRVLGREAHFTRELAALQQTIADSRARVEVLAGAPRLLNETLFALGAIGIALVLTGESRQGAESLPILGLWAYAGFRLLPSANRIAVNILALRRGGAQAADLERAVHDMTATTPRSTDLLDESASATEEYTLRHSLVVEGVSFAWDDSASPTLEAIDFTVRAGEVLGIAGPSGAGKSTLLDLVLALLHPTSGEIRADGRSVFASPRAWRRRIGYVPQEPLLLDDSLRRNVGCGLGDSEIDSARVTAALRRARLDGVVDALPLGIDTPLGDLGARLSGGERQRVALARALYDEPDLLLLDEPTSALDAATEAGLIATLVALKGSTTVIVVSHRPAVLAACDRVLNLRERSVESLARPGGAA